MPAAGFAATEFGVMRCDYMLASKALAACAISYDVIRDLIADTASDHYPARVTFEVPR